jgi:hypothetical protein
MSKPDIFLDTCIILSQTYGPEFDTNHPVTKALTKNGHATYTSLTVKLEGKNVLNRRKQFYRMMYDLSAARNDLTKIDISIYSEHDQGHLRQMQRLLQGKKIDESLKYLRKVGQMFDQAFDEEIGSLKRVLPRSENKQTQSLFQIAGMPNLDAQIATDFVHWGGPLANMCWLVSLDHEHVLMKRGDILRIVNDSLFMDPSLLDVLHPSEAVGRLGKIT